MSEAGVRPWSAARPVPSVRHLVPIGVVVGAILIGALGLVLRHDRLLEDAIARQREGAALRAAVDRATALAFELHAGGQGHELGRLARELDSTLEESARVARRLAASDSLGPTSRALLEDPPVALLARLDPWRAALAAWSARPAAARPPVSADGVVADGVRELEAALATEFLAVTGRARLAGWAAGLFVLVGVVGGGAAVVASPGARGELRRSREVLDHETTLLERDRRSLEDERRASEAEAQRMLSMLEDLEAQKERLQRAESQFRMAVEAAPNAMLMVDHRGAIALVNDEAERLFGYAREELLGQPVELLVPPATRDRHPALRDGFFARPAARPMGASRELHGLRKDGSLVPVEIGLNPIQTGEGLFVLSSVIDITERVRSRRAIEAYARDLERSNADLEQFAYVASHDLREPIRMVQSFGQLLLEELGERLDGEHGRYLAFMLDGAGRMADLVDGLLAYSRAGRELRAEPVSLREVVDEVCVDLQLAIEESGAVVETVGDLPVVTHDPVALRQVVQNLVGNAVKFRGEEAPRVEVSAERREGEWVVRIRDNGIGIDPRFAHRIFEVFQRLHLRDEYAGTGIGLSVVKKVVESRGGRVWLEPSERGSRFAFSVPDDVPSTAEAA